MLEPAVQRVYLAEPAVGQAVEVQRAHAVVATREPIDHRTGAVVGAVVDQDNFERRVIQRDQARDRGFEGIRLVAGRHQHADERPVLRRGFANRRQCPQLALVPDRAQRNPDPAEQQRQRQQRDADRVRHRGHPRPATSPPAAAPVIASPTLRRGRPSQDGYRDSTPRSHQRSSTPSKAFCSAMPKRSGSDCFST